MNPVWRRCDPSGAWSLLAYPPPFRAWLTLSNDPDNTIIEHWKQIHELVWEELALPFADSFFVFNHNEALPDQVNLVDHPEILDAHPHDSMHTWGDYMGTPKRRFNREEAELGLRRMAEAALRPLIWTDHAGSSCNLTHRGGTGGRASFTDASGHEYPNVDYSLDLIRAAGVRYAWDGNLTQHLVGQDRPVGRREWYAGLSSTPAKAVLRANLDRILSPARRLLSPEIFSYDENANHPYVAHRFADQSSLYLFRRYGVWNLADIDGLGELLSPALLERLQAVRGSAVIYTHLGKRRAGRARESRHIPEGTRSALGRLAEAYAEGRILLSSTSKFLDYLVLRDHASVGPAGVDFRADGLRFPSLNLSDLGGFEFGFFRKGGGDVCITCQGEAVACELDQVEADTVRIRFPQIEPPENRDGA
ncbi:MAG TPA: hypothetical protein VK714_09285 [Myxococcota bacterium]|nr:hypothetical protein [Myxococcota bacterium]